MSEPKLYEYQVSICCEEGVVIYIDATSKEDAKKKAEDIAYEYAGSNYPQNCVPRHVHRDFFINEVEKNS